MRLALVPSLLAGSTLLVLWSLGSSAHKTEAMPYYTPNPEPQPSCVAAASFAGGHGRLSFDDATGSCVVGNDTCSPINLAKLTAVAQPRFAALNQSSPLPMPAPLPPLQCQYAQPTSPPDWLTAALWLQEGSEIGILNGFRRGEISLYDLTGQLRKRIDNKVPLEAIVHYHNQLLVKGPKNIFYFLDKNLGLGRSIQIQELGSIYPGWAISGEEIVAYGSLPLKEVNGTTGNSADSERGYQLGFIGVNLGTGASRLIQRFESNDFYLINNQYIATANGEAYFLAMNKEARIFRVPQSGPATPLEKSVPEEYLVVPQPQVPRGEGTARRRFEELESLHMPVGLYGQGNFLYLLTRDPDACSPWSLYKIDPLHKVDSHSDRVVGRVPVPSLARHIALVPGDQHWLIIEKGAVEAAGRQKIRALKAIPAAWFTDPSRSPLKQAAKLNRCVSGD